MPAKEPTAEDYANSYGAYLKYSSQNEAQERMLSESFHLDREEPTGKIKVLSVGAGRGEFDMLILKALQNRLQEDSSIEYTVVEPNRGFVEVFQQRVKDEQACKNVVYHWKVATFDDYQLSEEASKETFDYVFIIHSSYYFVNLEDSMSFVCKKLLAEKGRAFVIAVPNEGHVLRVAEKYEQLQGIAKKSIPYSGTDVIALESKLQGFNFVVKRGVHGVDITDIFDADSTDGNYLLDFYTHTTDFRKTIGSDVLSQILDFTRGLARKDQSGRWVIEDDLVLVLIGKQAAE